MLSVLFAMVIIPNMAWGQWDTKTFIFNGCTDDILYAVDSNDETMNYAWNYRSSNGYYCAALVESKVKISIGDNYGKGVLTPPDDFTIKKVTLNYSNLQVTEGSKIYVRAVNRTDTTTHYTDPYLMTSDGTLDINLNAEGILSDNLCFLIFSNDDKAYSYILNSITITKIADYHLSIGGVPLTGANVNSETGAVTDMAGFYFTPASDTTPATLTLNNANFGPSLTGIVWGGDGDLKIQYSGNNTINTRNGSELNPGNDGYCIIAKNNTSNLILSATNDASTLTLRPSNGGTPDSNNSRTAISGFSNVTLDSGWGMYYTDDNSAATATSLTAGAEVIISKGTPLGITIAGVPVTSNNAANITGGQISLSEGGKVSYDSENKVLTLKGATIDMSNVAQYPIQSSLANLTIKLERDNTVNVNESAPFFVYYTGVVGTTAPTLAFDTEYYYHTTDGGYKLGTLTINNIAEIGSIASDYNFGDPDFSDEYIDPDLAGNATTGWKVSQNPPTAATSYVKIWKLEVFDLWIGSGRVLSTAWEAGQSGGPKYNPVTKRLVLTENVSELFPVKSSMAELVVEINGACALAPNISSPAISFQEKGEVTSGTLKFVKAADANMASITLTANGENQSSEPYKAIEGFTSSNITITAPLQLISPTSMDDILTATTVTISTPLLSGGSGTAADPFIIKTADDLKNFSKLVNNGTINTAAMYFGLAPEGGTLDCSGLSESEYKPIGSRSQPFKGTFSGNGCTISNLTAYQGGLFGNISGATIEDLNLSNCTIKGNDYCIAGLAADASNGSTINLCTITNSTIECLSNQYDPTVGGIVARLSDSGTTISNCVVNNTLIKAETTEGTSGIAGGIIGEATSGKIENCHIKGGSKITDYNNAGATLYAGAIVGKYDGEYTTLSGNDYYYDVTVETLKGTDTANKVTKDGYTQRALGNGDDVTENNGAVMYTKKVTFPTVTGVTITKDGDYYSYDATGINVAPGQTAKMIVEPSAAVKSFTATNVDDTAITSEALAGNKTRYSFEMPDAAVAVTLTMKEDPNLQFVYTWTRLRIGDTFSQEVKSDMPTTPTVTWSSSNEAVATVDADGVVTPVAAYGSDIEITATFAGDDTYAPATASYAVSVDKGEQYLRIMYKGKNIPLATVKVAKGNSIDIKNDYDFSCPEELVGTLVWYSNDENVVTVTNGVITTVGCGSTWIKVSSVGNSNYESDYCDFTIEVAPPTPTINLAEGTYLSTHAPITITKENIANTTISYTWDDITDNTITPTWENYTDAGVTIQEGTLSARVGYTTNEGDVIFSDTASVAYTVIIDPELKYMQGATAVTTAEWTLGKDGNTLPTLQNTHSVTVTYASSNTNVATVATDGTVTVVGIGTATITATSAATDVYAAGEASYTLTVKRQLTVSFSTSNEWATYYGTENLATPEGLKAYQVTAVEGATVTISEIGYIPANTAVLLKNVSNNNVWTNIAASAYTGATSTFASNKLIGTAEDVDVSTISGGTVYVLYNNMFKRATGGTIPANRGYLVVATSSGAPELSITIGDENTTAINEHESHKLNELSGEWFSIDGVKLNGQPQKPGLYIKNGKKVIINKK